MSTGRTIGILAATAVGISLLIWAGVHNGREQELKRQQARQTPEVALIRKGTPGQGMDSSMAMPPEPVPALQGKSAPAFTLVDLSGKKVSLADYKGRPVMVNFWATWCGPCKLEMPWLEEFQHKYAGDGLVILGVAADDAGKNVIEGTAIKLGVTYPILLADDKIESDYGGVDQLPESFYVGRDGKIAVQTSGTYDGQDGKDAIEANLKKLLAPVAAATPGRGAGR